MDEDIAIIDKNTRNERIKNFILKNKKSLIKSLAGSNIKWSGYIIFARYNSPWTLWFLKKN